MHAHLPNRDVGGSVVERAEVLTFANSYLSWMNLERIVLPSL
ncbi:hypothetical protein OKW76_01595 [Sphingomonas sp. S1-29]|nr:hypothetical protein [Sphingomonas sp. S1-29]UZK69788.1 hypothetical protein OKW76_01595 [Sphingomonas sp. S1-29]